MSTIETVSENWSGLLKRLVSSSSHIRVISPFISEGAARALIEDRSRRSIQVITRYKLEDFFAGVSQLSALEFLLRSGAEIRGLKGLHTKLYIFGRDTCVVSSANLTSGGLFNNLEFGLVVKDRNVVDQAIAYFDRLWSIPESNLDLERIEKWKELVDDARARRGSRKMLPGQLADEGVEQEQPKEPTGDASGDSVASATHSDGSGGTRVFVKFFGTGEHRREASDTVRNAISRAECHYACTWPKGRRPRKVKHGDIIYMAYLTKDPIGHAIFGRAWGIPHKEGRDDATANEMARQEWKEKWPHYIRVFDPVFIDGRLSDCVWLSDLMDLHGAQVFESTSRNVLKGIGNTNPRMSLRQQAAVVLTPEAGRTLEGRFLEQLNRVGEMPASFVDQLPKPDLQVAG